MKMQSQKVQTALILALGCSWVMTAQASKIYTCNVNGNVIYTSNPASGCQSADLPSIGRYSSARYDVSVPVIQSTESNTHQPSRKSTVNAPKKTTVVKTKSAAPSVPMTKAPTTTAPSVPKFSGGGNRRMILEQELANERKALSDVQRSLAEARVAKGGAVNQTQVNQLQSSVLDHQQNIQALQRELSRM